MFEQVGGRFLTRLWVASGHGVVLGLREGFGSFLKTLQRILGLLLFGGGLLCLALFESFGCLLQIPHGFGPFESRLFGRKFFSPFAKLLLRCGQLFCLFGFAGRVLFVVELLGLLANRGLFTGELFSLLGEFLGVVLVLFRQLLGLLGFFFIATSQLFLGVFAVETFQEFLKCVGGLLLGVGLALH